MIMIKFSEIWGNQQYNDETMFEYGWYSTNGQDVRTGYTNGIPTSGTDNEGLGKRR